MHKDSSRPTGPAPTMTMSYVFCTMVATKCYVYAGDAGAISAIGLKNHGSNVDQEPCRTQSEPGPWLHKYLERAGLAGRVDRVTALRIGLNRGEAWGCDQSQGPQSNAVEAPELQGPASSRAFSTRDCARHVECGAREPVSAAPSGNCPAVIGLIGIGWLE